MSRRITISDLDAVARRLNRMVGVPESEQRREPTEQERSAGILYPSTVGRYYFSGAYGGWELVQIVNLGGGVRDVLRSGHVPARQAYNLAHAYAAGLEDSMPPGVYGVSPEATCGSATMRARAERDLEDSQRRVAAVRAARERVGVELSGLVAS